MTTNVDPLQAFRNVGDAGSTLFTPNSRYYAIEVATLTTAAGEPVPYLRRRFVPPPERFQLVQEHAVALGDRLDNLAAKYLDDPELFWRLCDANGAIRPAELTEVAGRRLRITLPVEIPQE